jgi:hypothetical protein
MTSLIVRTEQEAFESRWSAWQLRGRQSDQRREDLVRLLAVLAIIAGAATLLFSTL